MIRVLFLQHGFGYGGATKSLFVMQQALFGKVEIHTAVKKNKRLNAIIGKELTYSQSLTEFDLPGVYSYSEAASTKSEFEKNKDHYPAGLIDLIRDRKIDILHVNSSVFSNLLKSIREHTTCKIVVHFREMLPFGKTDPIDSYIMGNTMRYADKIIAISPNELRFFPQSEKTLVLSNPHDFKQTDSLLNNSNVVKNKLVVGMCANFSAIKGHLVFIKAIQLVNETLDRDKALDVEFRIIGYPAADLSWKGLLKSLLGKGYKQKVDKLISRLNIKNLKLVPFTFNVLPEIAQLDIYVRPDLSANPWGRDIIEAMALKKPVIATGSSDYYVKDGLTGFLIVAGDPDQLAQTLRRLLNDPQLAADMGERGYAAIKQKCDLDLFGDRLMDIYRNIA